MNLKQQAFVCELLRHGNRAEAYRVAYQPKSNNPRSLQSAADRLMKNPEVAEAIHSVQESIYAEVQEELKARLTRELLTVQRKREILAQVAEGEWMIQPPPAEVGEQRTAVLIPTLKERLKAIDMDNRMSGAYEKEKISEHNPASGGTGNSQQTAQEIPGNELPVINESVAKRPTPSRRIQTPFIIPVVDSPDPKLNMPRTNVLNSSQQPPWLSVVRV